MLHKNNTIVWEFLGYSFQTSFSIKFQQPGIDYSDASADRGSWCFRAAGWISRSNSGHRWAQLKIDRDNIVGENLINAFGINNSSWANDDWVLQCMQGNARCRSSIPYHGSERANNNKQQNDHRSSSVFGSSGRQLGGTVGRAVGYYLLALLACLHTMLVVRVHKIRALVYFISLSSSDHDLCQAPLLPISPRQVSPFRTRTSVEWYSRFYREKSTYAKICPLCTCHLYSKSLSLSLTINLYIASSKSGI